MSVLQDSLNRRRSEEVAAISCVIADERQTALIISLWAGESWVLPWAQFVSARLEGEKIELSFGNYQVIVTGENLPALLKEIAAYRICLLRELPAEYGRKPAEGEPYISGIKVRPVEDVAREFPA